MIDEYCRLCGKNSNHLLKISDKKFDPILKLRIQINLHILISAEDGLSYSICNTCVEKLGEFNDFIKCCQQTQWKLLDLDVSPVLELKVPKEEISLTEEDLAIEDYVCDLMYCNEPTENESVSGEIDFKTSDESTDSKKIPYSKLVSFFSSKVKVNRSPILLDEIPAKRFCDDIHNIEIYDEKSAQKRNECLIDDDWSKDEKSLMDPLEIAVSYKAEKLKPTNLKTCPLCSHLFPPFEIEDHVKFHSEDEEYLQLIITEMYEVPFKHKTHYCEECKKVFVRDSLYMEHMREHAKIRMINCHLCDNKFSLRKKLKVHLRAVHIPKTIKCDLCSYASKNIADMQKHKRGVHEGQPIICEICGKSVSSNVSNYNRHLQTHSEERPYKCDLCNTAYKTAASLQKHRENIHFPKSVMCTACGTICGSRIKYKKHVRRCKKRMLRFS